MWVAQKSKGSIKIDNIANLGIWRFWFYEVAFSQKFIYNPKPTLVVLCGHLWTCVCTVAKTLSCLMCTLLAEVEKGDALPSYFISHISKMYPFVVFSGTFLHFCASLLVFLLFQCPQAQCCCAVSFLSERKLSCTV